MIPRSVRQQLALLLPILGALSVFFAALILYWPSLQFSALSWDDQDHIFRNPGLISGQFADILEFWKKPYFSLYIPVTYTIWALVYKICTHLNVDISFGLHLLNVLVHAGNGILLYRLARRIGADVAPAWILSLLFIAHPLQVGAVAWISGGRDLLANGLALVALNLCIGHLNRWRSLGIWTLFVASFLAKPSTVTLPLAAWFLCSKRSPALAKVIAASLIAGLGIAIINKSQQSTLDLDWQGPLWFRLPVAIDALIFYLKKFMLPWPLTADYGRSPEFLYTSKDWLISAFVAVALTIGGISLWRQKRLNMGIVHSIILYGVILFPVLGLIPFSFQNTSTVTDHYTYLIWLAALPSLQTWHCSDLPRPSRWLAASLVLCLVLFWTSRQQLPVWSNNQRFYQHMTEVNPNSFNGHINLAAGLLEVQNDSAFAEQSLRKALALEPGHTIPLYYMTRIFIASKRYQELVNLIAPWSQRGADAIRTRFRANPSYNKHLWSWIELHLALAYHRQGQATLTQSSMTRAISYDANNAYIYYHQGRIFNELGNSAAALSAWQRAVAIEPDNQIFQSALRQ